MLFIYILYIPFDRKKNLKKKSDRHIVLIMPRFKALLTAKINTRTL